jgi:hypothetical protein
MIARQDLARLLQAALADQFFFELPNPVFKFSYLLIFC